MWLFASDETLAEAQRRARAHDASAEDVADEREQRAHARIRGFAWLFFGPSFVVGAVAIGYLAFAAGRYLGS